ncbi:16S rRNA (uracil(1498)-N(3))-methyltransferase [Sphingobacterium corticibacterium]|uniref:Ribosomal RNA small subunit methyltransferase E n=1 Tax=Sphingobacterium corticibacterium TaxID=2484746 RepID=A0A4Q6XHE3_9SPHI|nr:16S rRNA (uracil(1498)-N(3))-methyltransferase [Sphingobacterium corticibacterium]RZF59331.1 16S rRNA (uracil(1498)-N(3))-methyltransferase [Sphingobacterium corticibacterium]
MHLFYTPTIEPHYTEFMLTEDESKHAIRVLRLTAGDEIYLVDGVGGWYTAKILDPHPKRTTLSILHVEQDYEKPAYYLHVAVAPTKNMDRMEWFLEKATEVGIQEITPIVSSHSERKEVKNERLHKVVIPAMKQSLKAYLPKVNPAVSLQQFFDQIKSEEYKTKAIAHCADGERQYLANICSPGEKYLILIGPEGDFSENEIAQALSLGYQPVSLGNSRLRTETAAVACCLEISVLNR